LLRIGHKNYQVFANRQDNNTFEITIDKVTKVVEVKDETALLLESYGVDSKSAGGQLEIKAPMPGLVLKHLVSIGSKVKKGDGLLILEAMKMENEIKASQNAIVDNILVEEGQAISKGDIMIVLKSE